MHEFNIERKRKGEFYTLITKLREDEKRFNLYFRMTPSCFDEILNSIKETIEKKDTNFRESIPPEERLAVTLRLEQYSKISKRLRSRRQRLNYPRYLSIRYVL